MLQITEQNKSLKLGFKKKTRALITTVKEWVSPIRGQNSHSPPPFFLNWDKEPKISGKTKVKSLIPIEMI